jgi:hypothetical protein
MAVRVAVVGVGDRPTALGVGGLVRQLREAFEGQRDVALA